ncbi:MAG TPA: hypothetical protein VFS37_06375 [Conexibacter sp.]|nr:hypothetical protein [Conexibacter sp.]
MSRREAAAGLGAHALAAWGLLAVALLVLLHGWQGNAYWEYSDGVYALTGRLVLRGAALYRDVAAAQPPPVYYVGAGVLGLFGDSVSGLRWGLSVVALVASLLVVVCTWRLTRSRVAAVAAGLVALVTPWALREHAQLVPETLAAPLVLGAALAGSRPGRSGALVAGLLAALAVAFKLAFALPALAALLAAQRRWRALLSFLVAGVVLAGGFLLAFGDPLLDGAVRAQRQTGTAGLRYVGGLWAQAGWNLLPLLACAALAWPARRAVADGALLRALVAAALGGLLLLATLFKHGSYLTVVVAIEPPLVCLAAAGVTTALRGRAVARLAVAGGAVALAGLQVGSLLVAPGDPRVFTRPFAAAGPAWTLSPSEVDRVVATMRACAPGVATSGPPYLAFAADRRIAGDQPDQFIVEHAAVLARFRMAVERDQPRCP